RIDGRDDGRLRHTALAVFVDAHNRICHLPNKDSCQQQQACSSNWNMQNFSEWMTALQVQQHSPASSYAETDMSDSDSDSSSCDDCQCHLETKRKFVTKDAQRVWVRTAPISIPSNGRQQPHPHLCKSVVESPDLSYHADMRLLRAGRYLHEDEDNQDELDEDDPVLYGNLAFFRSQYGASQTHMVKRSAHSFKSTAVAAPASPTGVDDRDDEDIFAMEL
ncbi:hypothetical protein L917_05925, partial [Phytophthora nicotianae]